MIENVRKGVSQQMGFEIIPNFHLPRPFLSPPLMRIIFRGLASIDQRTPHSMDKTSRAAGYSHTNGCGGGSVSLSFGPRYSGELGETSVPREDPCNCCLARSDAIY